MYKNRVELQGNLGADAEKHAFSDATKFKLRVATTRKWKDRTTGEAREETQWHTVVLRVTDPGRIAYFERELIKGACVDVEGAIDYRPYTDDQGAKRSATEIKAERVQIIPSLAQLAAQAGRAPAQATATPPAPSSERPLEPAKVTFG